jgi:putative DNA primase/helicase|uniref:Active helicase ring shaped helicase n=1 Tax=Siphoviridae sp. ctqBH20 TaxID=2825680 RepID=A0A8S5QC37_9CAUD|nr:MAG TPA: active helicase ring shaped helicase [Siphoviridae sp. ctqBH20]
MRYYLLRQEVKPILENIEDLQHEDFMKKELYEELFSIKSKIDRSEAKFRLLDRSKAVQSKKIADEFINEFQKAEREKEKEQRESRSMVIVDNITNFFPDSVEKSYPQMACGSWIATENGIFSSETSKAKDLVCHHPIMPVRRLKNIETGEEQITIAFKRDGYWTEITVPKIEVVTSRAITNLARFGVQVNSENARLLVKYLADLEMWNADMIDIQHSTSKLGWHGNVFVPYDLSIVFDGEYRFRTLFQSIQEQGEYFKWVTLAKQVRSCGRLEPRIALAASFASVLIQPLDALPFIVDFYGQTGGGKTVTINIAASVWGNPAPGAYVGNFRSTDTSLETRADMLNNFPMILDDSKNASQYIRDNYETLIYNLCSGKGKGRSNKELGAAKENTWSNVTICNGENPISEFADSGGAINRIIEIECSEDIYENPAEVNSIVMKNYGFAGRVFVGNIKKFESDELKEMKMGIENEFEKYNFPAKQVMAIATLLLADKLATDCIFQDGRALTVEDVAGIPTRKKDVSEGQRCYEFLLESLVVYGQHFDAQYDSIDQWGFIENDALGNDYVFFYIAPLDTLLKKNGFSRKAFTAWAMNRGLLRCSGDRDTYVRREGKKVMRYIVMRISDEVSEADIDRKGSQFVSVSHDLAVPFN